jgi:hypothetical protein
LPTARGYDRAQVQFTAASTHSAARLRLTEKSSQPRP